MNMQPRNKTVSVAWRCGSFLFLAKIGHQNLKNVIDYDSGFETLSMSSTRSLHELQKYSE